MKLFKDKWIISFVWGFALIIIGINMAVVYQNKTKNYSIIYFIIYGKLILTSVLVMQFYIWL